METEKTGRGPNISNEVKRLIIGQAIHDSKNMPRRALAIRLQDLIEKMGEISPTEETLIRMISEARNQQQSELDQPWSIGACGSYNIPPDIIPVLIRLQKLKASGDKECLLGEITIREAQWVTRLYPVAEPLINKAFGEREGRLRLLSLIVSCYVQRERVSKQMNEQYPNTSELDRIYFANEDILNNTFVEGWWDTFPRELQQSVAESLEVRRVSTIEELRKIRGRPLSDEEVEMINEGFDVAKAGGPVSLRDWVKEHPAMQKENLLVLDWMEIYSEALEGDRQ
jgi:hypothetical protein